MNDSLPLRVEERVDEVCIRFESAWQAAGTPPRIEDYLGDTTGAGRGALLRELLLLDLHYRRRRGEHPDALEYASRFPAEGDLIRAALAAQRPCSARPAVV